MGKGKCIRIGCTKKGVIFVINNKYICKEHNPEFRKEIKLCKKLYSQQQ